MFHNASDTHRRLRFNAPKTHRAGKKSIRGNKIDAIAARARASVLGLAPESRDFCPCRVGCSRIEKNGRNLRWCAALMNFFENYRGRVLLPRLLSVRYLNWRSRDFTLQCGGFLFEDVCRYYRIVG